VQHVAPLQPGRVELGWLEPRSHAPVGGHRPLPVVVADGDDHSAGALHDRTAELDAVAFELSRGELAWDVVSALADEPAPRAQGAGPRGDVRGLTAGDEPNRGRRVGILDERSFREDDDVEDEVADRAEGQGRVGR